MDIKNRVDLLRALRDAGYKGKNDLAEVKQFITDNDIEIEGIALDEVWKKTVTISVSADAGEDVQVMDDTASDPEGAMADPNEMEDEKPAKSAKRSISKAAKVDASRALSPSQTARMAARKRYNAKAARGETAFGDADLAEAGGAWLRLAIAGNHEYGLKSIDRDIIGKTMVTTTNTLGGALVPNDFEATLIDLKEDRGAARQVCPVTPMSRDTLTLPRRTGGVTVYGPGEAATITASDMTLNNVNLTAFKLTALSQVSTELLNDSAINVADQLAREIAYAFADKEDECFFNGDGTSTYYGVLGVNAAIKGLSGTIANIAGLTVGAGNAYSELVYDDFLEVMGKLPEYAARANARWVFSRPFQYTVAERVSRTIGSAGTGVAGATYTEAIQGGSPVFLGYPVSVAQVMPRTEANSQVCALLGDFAAGAKFGEVRGSMQIQTSDQRYFEQDLIAIRGVERIAMTVHDVGNASGTAGLRVPGPIVGLITAAS